jgi:tripartite-type tricarboxylate transporter receptor subunit TctC
MPTPSNTLRRAAALWILRTLLRAAPLAALPRLAQAQGQARERPLRVIVPVSTGTSTDLVVRTLAAALSEALGQALVIDNLPGAGGIVGTSALVKAAPDGYTIGVVSNSHAINQSLYRKPPFDANADVTPIMVMLSTPIVLAVSAAGVPAANLQQLLAWLEARPGTANYGSIGYGSLGHLCAEMFAREARVDIKHIPYRSLGQLLADLIGGQLQLAFLGLPGAQAYLKRGLLRTIGLCAATRAAAAPELPTLAEQGLAEPQVSGWFAMIGPARLPAAEVRRIHGALVASLATTEVSERLQAQGNLIDAGSPEAATQFLRAETARYAALIRKLGISID